MHIPRDTCLASVAVIFSITVFTATPASLLRATQGFQRSHLRSANGGRLPQAAKAFIFRGTFDHIQCKIVKFFACYRARVLQYQIICRFRGIHGLPPFPSMSTACMVPSISTTLCHAPPFVGEGQVLKTSVDRYVSAKCYFGRECAQKPSALSIAEPCSTF